jgi:hypothetical protein
MKKEELVDRTLDSAHAVAISGMITTAISLARKSYRCRVMVLATRSDRSKPKRSLSVGKQLDKGLLVRDALAVDSRRRCV